MITNSISPIYSPLSAVCLQVKNPSPRLRSSELSARSRAILPTQVPVALFFKSAQSQQSVDSVPTVQLPKISKTPKTRNEAWKDKYGTPFCQVNGARRILGYTQQV